MGMPFQGGKTVNQRCQEYRHGSQRRFALLQNPHLGVPFKDLLPVRRFIKLRTEFMSRVVAVHMKAAFPQYAFTDIEDLPLVCDIQGFAVLSVKFRQRFRIHFFHSKILDT
jgi:hypothetical protein